jgi:hypothetical protein
VFPFGEPECSRLWYPEVLAGTTSEIGGQLNICRRATGFYSSFGDKDCAAYGGGDPALARFPELYCSPDRFGAGLECRRDYYPSEERDVEFVRIDYQDHVCKKTYQGRECWPYYGGSTRRPMTGSPDYYYNSYGCTRSGYPSPGYGCY